MFLEGVGFFLVKICLCGGGWAVDYWKILGELEYFWDNFFFGGFLEFL